MKCHSLNLFFNNFSHQTRLNIITVLKEKPLSVTEIAKITGEEQSNVSHNLRKLAECRILKVRREGKQRMYSLNKKTVLPMLKLVENHVKNYCPKRCYR